MKVKPATTQSSKPMLRSQTLNNNLRKKVAKMVKLPLLGSILPKSKNITNNLKNDKLLAKSNAISVKK